MLHASVRLKYQFSRNTDPAWIVVSWNIEKRVVGDEHVLHEISMKLFPGGTSGREPWTAYMYRGRFGDHERLDHPKWTRTDPRNADADQNMSIRFSYSTGMYRSSDEWETSE